LRGNADLLSVFRQEREHRRLQRHGSHGGADPVDQPLCKRPSFSCTDADLRRIESHDAGVDLVIENGLDVKLLLFPGDDPDSFVRRREGEFTALIGQASLFWSSKPSLCRRGVLKTPEGKTQAVARSWRSSQKCG